MNMHVLLVPCTHRCVKVQCAMVLMHYGVLQHARNNSDMAMVPPMSLSPGSSDSFPMPPVSAFQGFPPPKPTSPEQPSADAGIPPKPASGSRYALPFRSENSTRHSAHTVSLSEVATRGTRRPGFFPLLPMSAFQRIPPPKPTSPEQPFTDADIPPKPASGPEFVHQPIILPFFHSPLLSQSVHAVACKSMKSMWTPATWACAVRLCYHALPPAPVLHAPMESAINMPVVGQMSCTLSRYVRS